MVTGSRMDGRSELPREREAQCDQGKRNRSSESVRPLVLPLKNAC